MRIAINALTVGPGMTGIGAYAAELLKAAARLTGEHEFCVLRRPGAGDDGLFAFAESWPAPNPTPLWEQTQLPGELAARGIGLRHSPLFTCPVVEEAPAAITLHDAVPEAMPETCSPEFLAFHRANAPRSLRAARFVVTTSESAKAEIVERMGADESAVRVLHQSVPDEFFEAEPGDEAFRRRLSLPRRHLLSVGRIEPRKNLETLLEAFGAVAEKDPEIGLVVAGAPDRPDYTLDRLLRGRPHARRVRQLGHADQADLPSLYASAEAFVFPTLCEGFGRPVAEAMAAGTPVVSSNASSIPEVSGGACLLVDPLDAEALAEAILRTLGDSGLRRDMAARGRDRAGEFTVDRFAERLGAFYREAEASL